MLLIFLFLSPLSAQTPGSDDSIPEIEKVKQRISDINREIEAGAPEQDQLEELKSILQRQLHHLQEIESIDLSKSDPPKLPPSSEQGYSIDVYDNLFDQLVDDRNSIRTSELSVFDEEKSWKLSQSKVDELKKRRRSLLDAIQTTQDVLEKSQRELELASLEGELRVAEAGTTLENIQLIRAKKELEQKQRRAQEIERKLAQIGGRIVFSTEDFKDKITHIEKRLLEISARRDEANARLRMRETLLEKARLRLETEAPTSPVFAQTVQAREAWVRTSRRQVEVLEEHNASLVLEKTMWERRFTFKRGKPDPETFKIWFDETKTEMDNAGRSRDIREAQLKDVRALLASLENQLLNFSLSSEMKENVVLEQQALQRRESILLEAISVQDSLLKLASRVFEEFDREHQTIDFSERFQFIKSSLTAVWSYELYTVGDSAVTVKKLSIALLVLTLGLWFSRRLVQWIRKRFLAKLKIKNTAKIGIEKILYYGLVCFVFLFALQVVNIPLTVFTFLGGSLAIAVGFGAQNILNNFISGLILMVEQPIKVDDMIEVDGVIGLVEEIGARSTRLKRYTGIHVVVPNSALLENNVVNWTLENSTLRTQVNVGVAYGSPIETVFSSIEAAVAENAKIHKTPTPDVIFSDFGDSALIFEIHFWVTVESPMEKKRIESTLRRSITRIFEEKNITISFPQRDVHLDTQSPLEIRIIQDGSDVKVTESSKRKKKRSAS